MVLWPVRKEVNTSRTECASHSSASANTYEVETSFKAKYTPAAGVRLASGRSSRPVSERDGTNDNFA